MTGNKPEKSDRAPVAKNPRGCSGGFSDSGGDELGAASSRGSAIESPDTEMQLVHTRNRKGRFVVYINSDAIGGRDSSHGRGLMRNFLYALTEIAPQPEAIILVNSAVLLAQPGSASLENLTLLHEQGVQILVAEKSVQEIKGGMNIAVGKPATMHAILHTLLNAEKVVSP